jgi:hypothetical protein
MTLMPCLPNPVAAPDVADLTRRLRDNPGFHIELEDTYWRVYRCDPALRPAGLVASNAWDDLNLIAHAGDYEDRDGGFAMTDVYGSTLFAAMALALGGAVATRHR